MPRLVRPVETKVITKDGEVHVSITLDLNINLDASGLNVVASAKPAAQAVTEQPKEDDNARFVIPDFSKQNRIKFGKTE